MNLLKKFLASEDGPTAVEYAVCWRSLLWSALARSPPWARRSTRRSTRPIPRCRNRSRAFARGILFFTERLAELAARSRRLGCFKRGVCIMLTNWLSLEITQLVELLTASIVAVVSTFSWLFLSART